MPCPTLRLPPLVALALALGCQITIDASTSETASSGGPQTTDASTTEGTSSSTTEGGSDSSTSATGTASSTEGTSSSTTEGTSSSTTAETTEGESTGAGACPCDDGEYCDWAANSCGALGSDVGVCEGKPDGCDDNYAPVCGCDGQVHGNECSAWAAGVDIDRAGGCPAPDGYFPCGARYCDPQVSYCRISISDVFPEPDYAECVPYPGACGDTPTCACLIDEPCADFGCDPGDPGITIVCPGG